MVASLLLRGMLAGLLAGLIAFGFARTFGEPQIDRAIAFEEQQAVSSGEAEEPEIVSRSTQAGIGLLAGILVFGASLGGLFALVFAYVQNRVSSFEPRGTAALIALIGFVCVSVVPTFKYPATPPAVGDPETIQARTVLYFAMLVLSIATAAASVGLAKRLTPRHGVWNAWIAASAAYLAVMAFAYYVLPTVNEVPENFSADLLWNFRIASLAIQTILWATIGLVFGVLAERRPIEWHGRKGLHRAAAR